MHPIDQDGLKQITEELLAIGVHLDEGREWWLVGLMLECSLDTPNRSDARSLSDTTPTSKWGKEGETWHWKQNSDSKR